MILTIAALISLAFVACDRDAPTQPVVRAGKATDDDCAFCDLFGAFNEAQEEEDETPAEEAETDSTSSEGGPDLIVQSPSASAVVLTPGQAFTLHVTVQNQGDQQAAATMLHYYRSNNATISASDTEVGTGSVDALDASATSEQSIALTASVGVERYYGACVASVSGESDTDNNCSSAVKITVSGQEGTEEETETDETPEEAEEDRAEDVPDDTPVTIPDAKLRAMIAKALSKASGVPITVADMKTLTTLIGYTLKVNDKGSIRDLTGLEFATNLTDLDLQVNDISDVSPLSGLTNLEYLYLRVNDISDVSPLSGLTNLTFLGLSGNEISDISVLRGLTNLRQLSLSGNEISDISVLRGLTNLRQLYLQNNQVTDISSLAGLTNLRYLYFSTNDISDVSPLSGLTNLRQLILNDNDISDVSPLSGLTNLRQLDLRANSLNVSSINDHIPALESHGVTVLFDLFREGGDFDIELVFLDSFSERQKKNIQYAARRWMSIIREDLPDYTFTQGWSGWCGDHSYRIPAGERIDDLRIYITGLDDSPVAWGGPRTLRETSRLPVVGCMGFNIVGQGGVDISLHEIGHVLGIGTIWDVQDPNGDLHFNGPLAIAAFNDAGGRNYPGKKVPLTRWDSGGHWNGTVLGGELMSNSGGLTVLSAITIQALADLGYSVDVTQAVPYTLPRARAAAKASAKITAQPAHTHVGQQQEPIYVVDPQGRIIRTLHR